MKPVTLRDAVLEWLDAQEDPRATEIAAQVREEDE